MNMLKKVIMLALCMVTHAACGMFDAVKGGNSDAVQKLIAKNPSSVHEKDSRGRTPLMEAAMRRNYDIAKLLLDNGAKVNEKEENGATVLMGGLIGRNEKIINLLLEKGADVNARDDEGLSVLMRALMGSYGRKEAVIDLLWKYGAQLSDKDTADVIKDALSHRDIGLIKILIDKAHKDNNTDFLKFISVSDNYQYGKIEKR